MLLLQHPTKIQCRCCHPGYPARNTATAVFFRGESLFQGKKKPGTHGPGIKNIGKRNMDDNRPDSDNQTQLLKVWGMQPEECKRISYFFTFIFHTASAQRHGHYRDECFLIFLKALPSGCQSPMLFCSSVAAR